MNYFLKFKNNSSTALCILFIVCLCLGQLLFSPLQKFMLTTFVMLYIFKATIILRSKTNLNIRTYLLYFTIWPGMDIRNLEHEYPVVEKPGQLFVQGYLCLLLGCGLLLSISYFSSSLPNGFLGFVGLVPFFLILHFGVSKIIVSLLNIAGVNAPLLFEKPFASISLRDFWSNRWNLAFVEMNRCLFFPLARNYLGAKYTILSIFVLSGLLHELAISYPSNGGWGLPTSYFLIQGVFFLLERKLKLNVKVSRVLVWLVVFLPLPLLFHESFRSTFVTPLYETLGIWLRSLSKEEIFSAALWVAALGHVIVLFAGIQLPFRLNWKEDLRSVLPFNRKILWNYGVFIFVIVLAFGAQTAFLHEEMIRGDKAALTLAALIGGFWFMRIMADTFYFEHSDWPAGEQFLVGHALLNTAFYGMCGTYLSLLFWHLS